MDGRLKTGQLVELNDGRVGWIRFIGTTSFQTGEWIGVELDEASGKNDGSVQGERYFDCEPGYGLFMRNTGITQILEEPATPTPRPAVKSTPSEPGRSMGPPSTKPRPSSVTAPSLKTSRSSLAVAPSKRISTAGRPTEASSSITSKRQSIVPSPSAAAAVRRQSILKSASSTSLSKSGRTVERAPSATSIAKAPRPITSAVRTPTNPRATTSRSVNPDGNISGVATSPTKPVLQSHRPSATGSTLTAKNSAVGSANVTGSRSNAAAQKEIDDLQARLRVLEKQRGEDRERLLDLERLKEERDRFEMIIQKLQSKYQQQQQENGDLKRQVKDFESKVEQHGNATIEHESIMEMATLDREMAEEKAEAYRMELDAYKSKSEELELENEILREENAEFGKEMSPDELTSKGWMQMQRENDRLREALLRLRDMSQDLEAQLREEVKGLEKDVEELSPVKTLYEDQRVKLLEREAEAEDLKEQLEAASGADDLVEQLTERNISLGEQLEQLRAEVQDLQSLTELNDELEVNHIEHEKQLQQEIDFKDSLVSEAARRAALQDEALNDQEYAIGRFRELVTNLQADLEDMKASKEITETEAQALDNRSRAVMDLNRQLQASATSGRVKTIDMELRKLEAQEAVEHLAIVQLFVPDTFHAERDSVLALFRFKRVAFKARLLHSFIRENVNAPGQGTRALDSHIFEACDALDKLVWIAALSDRFVNNISGSSLEQFSKFEGSLHEIEPVERTLNGYIELLKKEELKEDQVADGLTRSIAVMSHLGERQLSDDHSSYADQVLMKALLMHSHLENTAMAMHNAKVAISSSLSHAEDDEDDGVNILTNSTEEVISYARSARVISGKILRALTEMKSRSMALDPSTAEAFDAAESLSERIAAYARRLGRDVFQVLNEQGHDEPAGLGEILTTMRRAADSAFNVAESDTFSTITFKIRALMSQLSDLYQLASDLDASSEFERPPPPWVLRSKELVDSKNVSAEAQHEIESLNRAIKEKMAQMTIRNQTLEEANLKIEHLESRMRDATQKVTRIAKLEEALTEAQSRSKLAADELAKQTESVLDARAERDKWKAVAESLKKMDQSGVPVKAVGELSAGNVKELEGLRNDNSYLQQANRFLKEAARRTQAEQEQADNSWLLMPLRTSKDVKDRENDLRTKGYALLGDLTSLPSVAKFVKLERRPKLERLKWEPRNKTPQWQLSELELLTSEVWPGTRLDGPHWNASAIRDGVLVL